MRLNVLVVVLASSVASAQPATPGLNQCFLSGESDSTKLLVGV